MSSPRFLADHDLNEHLIVGVQRRNHAIEFVRAREVGLAESDDDHVLAYAAENEFIVVSHDVNTMTAAAHARLDSGQAMTGLIMVHQRDPIERNVEDLNLIWRASEAAEWLSQIAFLPL